MVTRVGHGGACCGAGHLYGFGDAENRNPDLIDQVLAQSPTGRSNNVMLNLTQMTTLPNVLQRLADRGFVMDGHFINSNHDSHVFSFSRADRRQPMTREVLTGLGINWPGDIISEDLTGDLPALPAGIGGNRTGALVVGQRYRIARPDHGGFRELTVGLIGTVVTSNNDISTLRWAFGDNLPEYLVRPRRTYGEDYHATSAVYNHSLEPVEPQEVIQPPTIPVMRHTRVTRRGTRQPQTTVVASLYANTYQTTGRSNTRYGSYEAALARQSARARGVRVDRLDIMSDGSENWVEGVTE